MKTLLLLLASAGLLAFSLEAAEPVPKRKSMLPPEPGTVEVEHLLNQPVFLTVLRDTPVYRRSTHDLMLGTLPAGAKVSLVGLSNESFRVRGRSRQGDLFGWIRKVDVVPPDPQLFTDLRKLHERQQEVEALIEAKQIALGMTADEVVASLGKPDRQSSKLSTAGQQQVLEYVVYDRVPQYNTTLDAFGRPVQTVVYVKMETGSLSVTLKDNVVESIEETKGNPLGGRGIKIVPPPVIFGL